MDEDGRGPPRRRVIRRGYDELAERYAERRAVDDREVAILESFLDSLSDPVRVLDAGCGAGQPILRRLCEAAPAVGLDLSLEQLRLARAAVHAAALVGGDMANLPFRDAAFDAAVAVDSVIHVPVDDHRAVVDEFARVLRPGGRVLVSEAPEPFERRTPDWLGADVEMHWSMAGADATRDHLRTAGFHIEDEWEAPAQSGEADPRPPFFAARLDD